MTLETCGERGAPRAQPQGRPPFPGGDFVHGECPCSSVTAEIRKIDIAHPGNSATARWQPQIRVSRRGI